MGGFFVFAHASIAGSCYVDLDDCYSMCWASADIAAFAIDVIIGIALDMMDHVVKW